MDAHFSRLAIPGPYPLTPPQEQEAADTYYVVDCGREVGIFTDKYANLMFDITYLTIPQHDLYPRHQRRSSRTPSQSQNLARCCNALQFAPQERPRHPRPGLVYPFGRCTQNKCLVWRHDLKE